MRLSLNWLPIQAESACTFPGFLAIPALWDIWDMLFCSWSSMLPSQWITWVIFTRHWCLTLCSPEFPCNCSKVQPEHQMLKSSPDNQTQDNFKRCDKALIRTPLKWKYPFMQTTNLASHCSTLSFLEGHETLPLAHSQPQRNNFQNLRALKACHSAWQLTLDLVNLNSSYKHSSSLK